MELRVYLIEYGAGVAAEPHSHPAAGIGFVIDGAFESAFGDEPVTTVRRGEAFTDPANLVHRIFRNASRTEPLRFLIAYVIPKDAPTLHPVISATSHDL